MKKLPFIIILALLLPSAVMAAAFQVSPIRVFLKPAVKTASLTMTNKTEGKVCVQCQVFEWQQDEQGHDIYNPTTDILFFPKIFSVEKDQQVIVRISYQGRRVTDKEKTYRLFVQELPLFKPEGAETMMPLRLGIPIFIAPTKQEPNLSIESAVISNGTMQIAVKNSGNYPAQIGKIKAKGMDAAQVETFSAQTAGWYLLPDRARTFSVNLPAEGCSGSKNIQVAVEWDQHSIKTMTEVDGKNCAAN